MGANTVAIACWPVVMLCTVLVLGCRCCDVAVGEAGWPVVRLCSVGVTVGEAGWPVVKLCSVGVTGCG